MILVISFIVAAVLLLFLLFLWGKDEFKDLDEQVDPSLEDEVKSVRVLPEIDLPLFMEESEDE